MSTITMSSKALCWMGPLKRLGMLLGWSIHISGRSIITQPLFTYTQASAARSRASISTAMYDIRGWLSCCLTSKVAEIARDNILRSA